MIENERLAPLDVMSSLPVESVSWKDAKAFCEKLSGMTNKTYRLPSEAEWEYACRARITGAYAGGLDAMAWYSKNSVGKTHPVGQKRPNAFKLYDMHGNVWEWCEDVSNYNYDGAPTDGSAWLSGEAANYVGRERVLRGGSWRANSKNSRSAIRSSWLENGSLFDSGVRVVVSARTQ